MVSALQSENYTPSFITAVLARTRTKDRNQIVKFFYALVSVVTNQMADADNYYAGLLKEKSYAGETATWRFRF